MPAPAGRLGLVAGDKPSGRSVRTSMLAQVVAACMTMLADACTACFSLGDTSQAQWLW